MSNRNTLRRKPPYFEGWYLKQQNESETVALIPAFHADAKGSSASLQVITNKQAYHLAFPAQEFQMNPDRSVLRLGHSVFSRQGCRLQADSPECSVQGTLHFRSQVQPSYDIMGPFCAVPLLQCRHSVFTLFHRVDGSLRINGALYSFQNASGYWEGDRGVSFPKRYVWTHCSHGGNSIMLSIADIPFLGTSFVGCIGFVYWNGIEHRIATYCGVRLLHISDDFVLLKQGGLVLKIKLLSTNSHLLRAPKNGSMSRHIRESAACRLQYTCKIDGKTLFDFVSEQASFEDNWRNAT